MSDIAARANDLGRFEFEPHQSVLLDHYRRQQRTEPCACGGSITAGPHDESIRLAVFEHQNEDRHWHWAQAQGYHG